MGVREFVSRMKADLDRFQADYEANLASPPDGQHWPAEMSEGDWYDQFLMFEGRQ